MKHLGLYLLCIAVLCPLPSLAQDGQQFEGGWDWVRTEYSDGTVETPASQGFTVQLYFSPENEFIRYRGETEFQVSTWSLGCAYIPPYLVEFLSTGVGDSWNYGVLDDGEAATLYLYDHIELPNGAGEPPSVTEIFSYRGPVSAEENSWGSLKATYR